jgi:hypothetical protein
MFNYLDNALANNWLNLGTVNATTTPTGQDLVNAIGPVMLTVKAASGGSGTLALQPVMSLDNVTFVNVPADSILDSTTGLATTLTNITGSAGSTQTVYLKRDALMRYVSITLTPVVAFSATVAILEAHQRAYTSTTV